MFGKILVFGTNTTIFLWCLAQTPLKSHLCAEWCLHKNCESSLTSPILNNFPLIFLFQSHHLQKNKQTTNSIPEGSDQIYSSANHRLCNNLNRSWQMSGWSSGSHDLTPCLALGGTSLQSICLSVWCIFHICRTLNVSVLVTIIPVTRLWNGGKVDLLTDNKNSINSNKVRVWPKITDFLAVVGTSLQPRCLSVVFISLENIKLYQDY